jgi:hypothetical protein
MQYLITAKSIFTSLIDLFKYFKKKLLIIRYAVYASKHNYSLTIDFLN